MGKIAEIATAKGTRFALLIGESKSVFDIAGVRYSKVTKLRLGWKGKEKDRPRIVRWHTIRHPCQNTALILWTCGTVI